MQSVVQAIGDRVPLGYALRQSLKGGYSLALFKHDAIAGLIVSLVALPLAMALSIAVGLPPRNGLYTAIAAGILVPLLGGSVAQVSGPTAAFVVIVAPIVAQYGLHGLIITEIMAGLFLIGLGLARLGRYINYVPYPVVTGFTSGIAVVIGTMALNDLLGLGIFKLQGDYIDKVKTIVSYLPAMRWPEATVGLVSLVVMFLPPRLLRRVPAPIAGIAAGTLLALLFGNFGYHIVTIGSRFTYDLPGGAIGHGVPPFAPALHWFSSDESSLYHWPSYVELKTMLVPAMVVAALGALESLLSATVADGMMGSRHNPNAELLAIGTGNILSGLVMGVPATGAIARTATNIHSGARTPLASSMHALLILVYVLALAPVLSAIPMASLAALLVNVAYRMSHYRQFIRIIQIAPRSDTIVLLVCFSLTVFVDMVAGVTAGIVLASFLFAKRIAELTHADISAGGKGNGEHIQHMEVPEGVMVYHIHGSLFFGTVEKALEVADTIHEHVHTLIIDVKDVPMIDMTGLVAMKNLIMRSFKKGTRIMLCGEQGVMTKVAQKVAVHTPRRLEVFPTVEDALKACHA